MRNIGKIGVLPSIYKFKPKEIHTMGTVKDEWQTWGNKKYFEEWLNIENNFTGQYCTVTNFSNVKGSNFTLEWDMQAHNLPEGYHIEYRYYYEAFYLYQGKIYLIEYGAFGRYLIPADGHVTKTHGSVDPDLTASYVNPFVIGIYVVPDSGYNT